MSLRARFAPSPTGRLHVGNARTALFNFLLARNAGGQVVLRIEDTDQARSLPEHEAELMESLAWLGVSFDESPDQEGSCGPYRQSERLHIYHHYLEILGQRAQVYPCYCTDEELEQSRKAQLAAGKPPRYEGRCRKLAPSQQEELRAQGRPRALRLHVEPGRVTVNDLIRGAVDFDLGLLGDFVLLKDDKTPSYNFAVVVDDHLMGITHVLRGEDHLANTPRQLLLYRLFGWDPPAFAHHSLLLGSDGKKLSKRHGHVSVADFRAAGMLPEALANYLALLGGNFPSGREVLRPAELVEEFEISRVGRSAAIFDPAKLRWLGGKHMLLLSGGEIARRLEDRGIELAARPAPWLEALGEMCRENAHDLAEAEEVARLVVDRPSLINFVLPGSSVASLLTGVLESLQAPDTESPQAVESALKRLSNKLKIKGKAFFHPLRLALTGKDSGPELPTLIYLLGQEETRQRLQAALARL